MNLSGITIYSHSEMKTLAFATTEKNENLNPFLLSV